MKSSLLRIITLLAIGLLGVSRMHAQASLSVQGTLLKGGTLAAIDDGQYDITFKLYTTDAGGAAVWSETQSISITGGVYSVLLGAVNPLNIPFDQTYYLGLTLPGAAEHTPRTQLTAAPYALSLLGQENKFPSTGMVQMGSVATGTDISTATSYTVGANDHVIYLDHTANQNVTLPAATAANAGRQLLLVNKATVAKTLTSSNYVDLAGATSTTVPATGVVELQSDGSVWRQTGGYVQPTTQAKAYVRLTNLPQTLPTGNSFTALQYAEISDAQNCWNTSTHTFTAPRTGIYTISGSVRSPFISSIPLYIGQTGGQSPSSSDLKVWEGVPGSSSSSPVTPMTFSVDWPMTAGQTVQVLIHNIYVATPSIIGSNHLTIREN